MNSNQSVIRQENQRLNNSSTVVFNNSAILCQFWEVVPAFLLQILLRCCSVHSILSASHFCFLSSFTRASFKLLWYSFPIVELAIIDVYKITKNTLKMAQQGCFHLHFLTNTIKCLNKKIKKLIFLFNFLIFLA